jgi:hypothetical protein
LTGDLTINSEKIVARFHVFINFEPVDGSVEAEGSGGPLKCRVAL